MADNAVAVPNRFVMVEQRLRVLQAKLRQAAAQPPLSLAQQGLPANEAAGLVELDHKAQARLQGAVLVGEVVAPVPVTLLQAQGIQGVIPGVNQAKVRAGGDNGLIGPGGELSGDVELPAQLPHIGDPGGPDQAVAQFDLPARSEGKTLRGQVRRRQGLQQGPRLGPHQRDHPHGRGDIGRHATGPCRDMALQPVKIPRFRGGGGDDQVAVLAQARHRQVGLYAALLVQPLRIDDAPGGHIHIVGANPVQRSHRVPALQAILGERGLIKQPRPLPRRPVFGGGIVKPVLPPIAVLVAGRRAGGRVPVGPLPAGGLAVAGAGGF